MDMPKTTAFAVRAIFCSALIFLFTAAAFPSDWRLIGPEGGDVRSLAYDPSNPERILLGTSAGQMFDSQDGGKSWSLFAHLAPGDDYVLDHIIFDPAHPATIYVAGWSLYNADEGDVFRSDDSGHTWRALPGVHGKSVRAMAMAPSDPNLLVIGALDGVFRSNDGGNTWNRISPENNAEIKNIESLAIDPQNPDIIYAGTWHLPWKTEDGGKNWHSIRKGIAFDSDMFSIIVDPRHPDVVYASACSGMYKSVNKAEDFHRIYMSLPTPAHRTRVMKQDTQRSNIVYGGTVAGLWKSVDGGDHWKLVTNSDVVVNDVLIDPANPDHVLVATDRGGVLASNNAFATYETSNHGFAHRVIGGVVADNQDPNRIYVGVVNDKNLGGVFVSDDGGSNWRQTNSGLEERDILSLQQTREGVMFAGTNHGVFYLNSAGGTWEPATMIMGPVPTPEENPAPVKTTPHSTKKGTTHSTAATHTATAKKPAAKETAIPLDKAPRVLAFDLDGDKWYAATNDGLFISSDHGHRWYGMPVEGEHEFIAVTSFSDGTVGLIAPKHAYLSRDDAKTWSEITFPNYVTGLYNLTQGGDGSLWMGTREGALHSIDGGATWEHVLGGLPARNVYVVRYDPASKNLLATAQQTHGVYESTDGGQTWHRSADTGVSIRAALNFQGRLLAASAYNGLLLQQGEGGASPETAHAGAGTSSASQQ
jgi:photosystem II stability/assembly factor-like uncharacterized protein